MRKCHHCGYELDAKTEVHRFTACPSCRKDLRVCLNCTFYSPGSHRDCHETIDELVRDKDRSNFCSYFSFKQISSLEEGGPGKDSKAIDSLKQARGAFDQLFGDND